MVLTNGRHDMEFHGIIAIVVYVVSVVIAWHLGRYYVNHKLSGMSPEEIIQEVKKNSKAAEVVGATVDDLKPYFNEVSKKIDELKAKLP
jgi:hypothetical protein